MTPAIKTGPEVFTDAAPLRWNLEKKQIPSLDGLRGIAALSVALAHIWGLSRWIPADYAVVLFFEISGLLITWLLLRELDQAGSIDRLAFVERRALRLFPAFYVLWMLILAIPRVPGRWWSFFYSMDFYKAFSAAPWSEADVLGMAWSLGIEEKFYLIWPNVLRRFDRRSILRVTLVLFVCVQVYHVLIYKSGHMMWAAWGLDTRVDAILLGSSLAIAIKLGWLPPRILLNRASLFVSLLLVMALAGVTWVHRLSVGVLLAAFPLAVILMSVIARPPRILNNKTASFFGKISYSLYLYNPLIVYVLRGVPFANTFERVAISLLAAILAATLSYYLIERPFLRLKGRLHREPASGPRNPGT